MKLNGKIPEGKIYEKWQNYKDAVKPVSPSNKRKFKIIVVGSGLAGASAAATLGEQGYNVSVFTFHDSTRRAHSIAAQGGINAAKNYQNDNDSIFRLFYDTVKGGDFRAREANVYRLAQESINIIDQCVAQGVPFARDYGGFLDNRSFGGALVSRTFYARGQTGQQLLLGAYSALSRQVGLNRVQVKTRTEMLDLIIKDGHAKGIVVRDLITGELSCQMADAIVIATGGYAAIFYLSTNAINCNVSATFRAYKRGALFANPCYTQIHPTCIPVSGEHQSKLTLMSESLRNDGRVWVPKKQNDKREPKDIPEEERDYYLEHKYPSYGNLAPRDIASRAAKQVCDEGRGVGRSGLGVYLDFKEAISRLGVSTISARYGNLFEMYQKISNENPYRMPMRIYPASHYTMGGLWVDYELMSNLPGLFVLGEANFSDHGANRLGASALMQGLADGYFVLPYTICNYLNSIKPGVASSDNKEAMAAKHAVKDRIDRLFSIQGKTSPDFFHKQLGKVIWEYCGMTRNEQGINKALKLIPEIREHFYQDLALHGDKIGFNPMLEKALRVADFLQFGELMCQDALVRNESCGGHFREEYQTNDGEALRNDDEYCHVAAWKHEGEETLPSLIKEPLTFEAVELQQRSYK
jgi:succinate dehydrogenase / fumarate reductase, flavoprotein subunit